jgi:hypothetical protein
MTSQYIMADNNGLRFVMTDGAEVDLFSAQFGITGNRESLHGIPERSLHHEGSDAESKGAG